VVGPRLGQPPDDHVGITDGLDLLQPSVPAEPVEGREEVVEHLDHLLGGDPLAAAGEVDDVRHGVVEHPAQ
jgi:hypothetical protein